MAERQTAVEAELSAALQRLELGGQSLLLAVSGGVDSLTLADAALRVGPAHGVRCAIAHIDHALRGAESDADRRFVEHFAESRNVAFRALTVDLADERGEHPSRSRPTVQEAARRVRYAALEALRRELGADWILTAHSADDQAETVLMRVLRGAAPESLAGIAWRDRERRLARPLLGVTREQILAHARTRELDWREDSSNHSDRYTRNRLRNHWIPALASEFNPRLLRSVAELAETMSMEREWLRELVEAEASRRFAPIPGGFLVDSQGWDAMAPALARRLVRWSMIEMGLGRDLTRRHIERMLEFLGADGARPANPGRTLELPGGVRLRATSRGFELLCGESDDRRLESASMRPC